MKPYFPPGFDPVFRHVRLSNGSLKRTGLRIREYPEAPAVNLRAAFPSPPGAQCSDCRRFLTAPPDECRNAEHLTASVPPFPRSTPLGTTR